MLLLCSELCAYVRQESVFCDKSLCSKVLCFRATNKQDPCNKQAGFYDKSFIIKTAVVQKSNRDAVQGKRFGEPKAMLDDSSRSTQDFEKASRDFSSESNRGKRKGPKWKERIRRMTPHLPNLLHERGPFCRPLPHLLPLLATAGLGSLEHQLAALDVGRDRLARSEAVGA